jgi:DNA-binding NarL/FixJ family response regulator
VVGLSMHEDEEIAANMMRAGASSFVNKSGPTETLLSAVRAAARRPQDKPSP